MISRKEYQRAYYTKHREKILNRSKEWMKKNRSEKICDTWVETTFRALLECENHMWDRVLNNEIRIFFK